MKKSYKLPTIRIVYVSKHNIIATSHAFEKTQAVRKDLCSKTICPFNKQWCSDKQKQWDEWCDSIGYMAKNRVNQSFIVSEDSFEKCPNEYTVLCAQYKEKQRG